MDAVPPAGGMVAVACDGMGTALVDVHHPRRRPVACPGSCRCAPWRWPVNEIAHAVAQLIDNFGWLLFVFLFFGGGDVLGRALSGRRKNARLKGEVETLQRENDRLNELLTSAMGSGPDGPRVAELVEQARTALDDRSELMDLVTQVQSTDRAVPQLPQELRDQIDQVLVRYRSRLADRDSLAVSPVKRHGRKKATA